MSKLLFLIVFVISGCSTSQHDNNHLSELLSFQNPQMVLQKLQETPPAERDLVQYNLNIGFLKFINGDFEGAISTLSFAKQQMTELSQTSISENVGAGTINENLRSYSGYPTDRVMIHNILALSYLFHDEVYEARVEMLQSELAMQKLDDKNSTNGQLASAHLLAGIIYELLDELSNALISYRDSADIINKRGTNLPLGLKQALLRVSFKLGSKEQYSVYQQQFPGLPVPNGGKESQLFALYFDGVVGHKIQNTLIVPTHNIGQYTRISMPFYPQINKQMSSMQLINNQFQTRSEVVENVDFLVRDDLDKEYSSILLLTTTRAITKYQLVKEAQKQDPLLGAIFSVASILTEDADLRSWNMLPSNIQFAYMEPTTTEVFIESNNLPMQTINIMDGTKNVLLLNSLTNNVFHYQQ